MCQGSQCLAGVPVADCADRMPVCTYYGTLYTYCSWDITSHMLAWFDVHLKGAAPASMAAFEPLEVSPTVQYFNMGACGEGPDAPGNEWRAAPDWPLPSAVDTSFWLSPDGVLGTTTASVGDQGPRQSHWTSDPNDPLVLGQGVGFLEAADQREYESRSEAVLSFTSAVLR
jgi:predicted acyl esterase